MPRYFAYGSNMDGRQMEQRCPVARFLCVARLADHRLAFTRYSRERGCGVADIIPKAGECVWGVVYELSESDLSRLDCYEGYKPGSHAQGNAYNREKVAVFAGGRAGEVLSAYAYVVSAKRHDAPPPSQAYLRHLLCGARRWRLPESYIRCLEAVRTAS
jgi:gamma-glutamylcyclotransferase